MLGRRVWRSHLTNKICKNGEQLIPAPSSTYFDWGLPARYVMHLQKCIFLQFGNRLRKQRVESDHLFTMRRTMCGVGGPKMESRSGFGTQGGSKMAPEGVHPSSADLSILRHFGRVRTIRKFCFSPTFIGFRQTLQDLAETIRRSSLFGDVLWFCVPNILYKNDMEKNNVSGQGH